MVDGAAGHARVHQLAPRAQLLVVGEGIRPHRGVEQDPGAQVARPGSARHHRPRYPVPQPPPDLAPHPACSGHADHPHIPTPDATRGLFHVR